MKNIHSIRSRKRSMAKTKSTPGPKPTYGPRKDYHLKLPYELAEAFEKRAGQFGGVIKYLERLVRQDLGEQLPEGKEK